MSRLFGTDGVRGVANKQLTADLAFQIGRAATHVLSEKDKNDAPLVIIGQDTRISGDMLGNALAAGVMSMGGNVMKLGVITTPGVAYLVKALQAEIGVVISASHNSFEYNGIKIFNKHGFKLEDEIEDEIQRIIEHPDEINNDNIVESKVGRIVFPEEDPIKLYTEFLKGTVSTDISGIRAVIDCANGATSFIAPKLFAGLGVDVVAISRTPNGCNINLHCGSTHLEDLQKRVLENRADIGLAFDGDADRLMCVDEKGNVVDGDQVIYVCAKKLMEKGELPGNIVTATIMSNLGYRNSLERIGCKVDVTKVGDRYVLEQMLKSGGVIGGEQSGHIIFLNHTTTGDGMLSGLQVLQAIKESGCKLSEIVREVELYPQILKNAKVSNEKKQDFEKYPEITDKIAKLEAAMNGKGRILIRPSGTEPMVRVLAEGENVSSLEGEIDELAALLSEKLA